MSSPLELLSTHIFSGMPSKAAYDLIKIAWQKANERTWEELYLDAFEAALHDESPRLARYADGDITLTRDDLRRVLHYELGAAVPSMVLSDLTDEDFANSLAEALAGRQALIIGGHNLTEADYAQMVRRLVQHATALFRAAATQSAFQQAMIGQALHDNALLQQTQAYLQERFDLVLLKLDTHTMLLELIVADAKAIKEGLGLDRPAVSAQAGIQTSLEGQVAMALRSFRHGGVASSPLKHLELVQRQLMGHEVVNAHQAANQILLNALALLEPRDQLGTSILRQHYVLGYPVPTVAAAHKLAEESLHNVERRAISQLTELVSDMERRISTIPSLVSGAQSVYDLADYDLTLLPGGEGGAARVYKGVSRRDGTTVAVKVLYRSDPNLRKRFEFEGRSIGLRLRHPHIIDVLHFGELDDGTFYIIMKYMDNGSLRKRIQPRVGLSLNEAIRITGETCDALHYAHGHGIIFRDVKPENILFDNQDNVVLADFGLAKLTGARVDISDGLLIGTPHYMSYEVAKGQPVDLRSDLYSLGVVLYEMLTGWVPFTGDALTVVHKHITEAPKPPSKLNSKIPPHVERVVMKALEKNIKKRFATGEQMAQALGYTTPFTT